MRRGPQPAPRRRLNPQLRERARDAMRDGTPAWLMAGHAGFPQPAALSTLLHAPFVPATPTNIQRLQRLADKIHFPREQIFLEETEQEVEASA